MKRSPEFRTLNRTLGLVALLALVSACSSTPPGEGQTANAQMNCTRETPTGTSIPVTRCRTAQQAERDRDAAQDFGTMIRAAPGSTGQSGR
ncbi:MAG: hypothetical protein QM722_22825 [Piscinibacter sp.]